MVIKCDKIRSKSKRVNKLNSIPTLSKMIIFCWLLIASQFTFDIIAPNIMTEQKGKGYQGIGTIEVFEYKNTRSNVVITEKNEKQYVRLQLVT